MRVTPLVAARQVAEFRLVPMRFRSAGTCCCRCHSHRGFSPVVKTRGEYQEPFQRFRRLLLNLPQKSKPLKRFQVFV